MAELRQPEEIDDVSFSTRLRGYAPEEVDAFVLRVRETVSYLRERADNAYQRLGEEIGSLLQEAKDHAEEMRRAGEEESARLRQEASASAERTKQEAESQAAALRRSAEEEASARLDEAEQRVRELADTEAAARRRLEELRVDLQAVVEQLQALGPVESERRALQQSGPAGADAARAVSAKQTIRFDADTEDVKP